jgi:hypothetical protein
LSVPTKIHIAKNNNYLLAYEEWCNSIDIWKWESEEY